MGLGFSEGRACAAFWSCLPYPRRALLHGDMHISFIGLFSQKKGTSCVYNGNHFISREKEEKPSQPALFWEIGSAYLSGNLVRVERLKVRWVGLAVFTLPILRYRCFLGEQNISHTYDCDQLRVVQSLNWMQCPSWFPPHRTSFRGFLLTNGCTGNLWL